MCATGASLIDPFEQLASPDAQPPPAPRAASPAQPAAPPPAAMAASDPMADLLGLEMPTAASQPQAPPPPPPPQLQLRPSPQLSPADFQRLWGQLPAAATFAVGLSPAAASALSTRQLVSRRTTSSLLLYHSAPCVAEC